MAALIAMAAMLGPASAPPASPSARVSGGLDQRPVASRRARTQHGGVALDLRMPALDRDGGPRELIAFALDNLGRMQLDSALFCEELVAGDPAPRGTNLRYTLMTWLGLHKAQATGYAHDFDLDRIRHALIARLDAPQLRPGDLGLHLWVDALAGREHGDDLLARLRGALAREGGMQAREGMEIAWIMLGH